MSSRQAEPRGLTMVEVLIASVVVASAGLMLGSGLLAANRSHAQHQLVTLGTEALASGLALVPDAPEALTPQTGQLVTPYGTLRWDVAWTPDQALPLADATVSVSTEGLTARATTTRLVVAEP